MSHFFQSFTSGPTNDEPFPVKVHTIIVTFVALESFKIGSVTKWTSVQIWFQSNSQWNASFVHCAVRLDDLDRCRTRRTQLFSIDTFCCNISQQVSTWSPVIVITIPVSLEPTSFAQTWYKINNKRIYLHTNFAFVVGHLFWITFFRFARSTFQKLTIKSPSPSCLSPDHQIFFWFWTRNSERACFPFVLIRLYSF